MSSFTMIAAAASTQVVFTTQPTNSFAGAVLPKVVVQLADKNGSNAAQSGVTISLGLSKPGLSGMTNVTTDATGKASFTNLVIAYASTGYKFTANSTGLKSATSASFNLNKGSTATALASSTNLVVYGQPVVFKATVGVTAPAAGKPTGAVTFKDGTGTLGTAALNAAGIATFSTNRLSAVTTNHTITAVYAGDTNFLTSTSSNLIQTTRKLALTVSGIIASNKLYDGTTNAALNFTNATLAVIVAGDTVTLYTTSAKGAFLDKSAGAGKTVLISGLALSGASAGSYSVIPATATATVSPRNLIIAAKGLNKVYDGTTKAAVTLTDNRLAGDLFTNGYTTAAFTNKNVGTTIAISVTGLFITGTNAGNYNLSNLTASASANITVAPLKVSGVIASNKVYDATTTASLNFTNAQFVSLFSGDSVTLNTAAAKGVFAGKGVGAGKTVTISGLALAGTNAANYLLTQPTTTASITPRGLTLTAKGINRVYNGTTNATVTLTDNRASGDVLTNRYASAFFINKNVNTNILINVYGLAVTGNDFTNYVLTATNTTAAANITKAGLTVAGVTANNKIYDRTTTATLNFSNATLATIFSGDTVTLNTNAAKGTFASKAVGTNKIVTIAGLALAGVSSNNYSLTQPSTTANITARSLAITARGVAKIYDGTTNATVTLTDNRVSGDLLTNSYASAFFISKNVGTNILVNVSGLATAGTDAANYALAATNTATATNITQAPLVVTAASLSRPYATTNPVLFAICTGFVPGESFTNSDVTGTPALATAAKTNSSVGNYPITISKGSLASVNYSFKFTNGVLTVTKADTTALVSTTVNPALTNQNITFGVTVCPQCPVVLPLTGVIQFRCNGTNKLGNALNLTSGAASLTVPAAALGQANSTITAEYSDPAGNFNSSTNSLTQNIIVVIAPPPPSSLAIAPAMTAGVMSGQLSGVAGQTYVIEASADLVNWTPISTNTADAGGAVSLVDSNAVAFPSRYYRAYSP